MPFVRPLTRFAATAGSTAEIPGLVDEAWAAALRPHSGPAFVDLPLDHVFMEAEGGRGAGGRAGRRRPRPTSRARSRCSRDAERPVIMAGTDLYWGRGEDALRELVEARRIPVFLNGLARGCIPADHELLLLARALDRAQGRRRRAGRRRADGLPARLRQVVRRGHGDRRDRRRRARARRIPRAVADELYGDLGAILSGLAGGRAARHERLGRDDPRPPSARSARPSASCARTRARRCTRCASTPSSARCSTATRS